MVAEEYLSNFHFTGLTIDQALRSVLMFNWFLSGTDAEEARVVPDSLTKL